MSVVLVIVLPGFGPITDLATRNNDGQLSKANSVENGKTEQLSKWHKREMKIKPGFMVTCP